MSEQMNRSPAQEATPAPRFSVLVAFRDREVARVRRFLDGLSRQSWRDFELIFVDYGSTPALAAAVEPLVRGHGFARYLYNDTRGMPWNRSHALNSAARASRGEYLLCTDIDLVFSSPVLGELAAAAAPATLLHGGFYLLPRGFRRWEELGAGGLRGFRRSPNQPLGALQVVPREAFFRLQGFDEFYRIWGVEDHDFALRLERSGCARRQLELSPVYHQWHPSAAVPSMPAGWLDVMNFHCAAGAGYVRNPAQPWGVCLDAGQRPSRQVDPAGPGARRYVLPYWRRQPGSWLSCEFPGLAAWAKVVFIREFFGEFAAAAGGSRFICEVRGSPSVWLWEILVRTVFRHKARKTAGRRFFDYRREARDIIWYAIVFSGLVADYSIEEVPGGTRYVLVRK